MKSPHTPNDSTHNNTVISFPTNYSIEDITAMSNSSVVNPPVSNTPTTQSDIQPIDRSTANNYPNYLQWIGGRKQLNGYIGAILLTGMAIFLNADFPEYATAVLVSLGITSLTVAAEDGLKKRQ